MYDIIFVGLPNNKWKKLKQRFPTAKIASDFFTAQQTSMTKMFWVVWPDLEIRDDFDFSYQADAWSKDYIHVFKNGEHYDGVILCNKRVKVSKKEIDYRFFTNKKEIDIQASTPACYDIFNIETYEDYVNALETSNTEMFWVVWPDLDVDFDFNWYYSHHNSYDRKMNHVFKNGDHYDGIVLCSKHAPLSKREIDFRFVINRKEIDVVASTPKPFDVVFISYNEPNADENYQQLLEKAPHAKRVHGVKGIHRAHVQAAKQCSSSMFWVVDADAVLVDNFNFDFQVPKHEHDCVHVWRSENPVNGLVYGYGGVKLLPRELTENVDLNSADMTTSISKKFKAVNTVSNITAFNTDPFSTWRSAFRECAKLSSQIIHRQKSDETLERLEIWTTKGEDAEFGEYAIAGAKAGQEFGVKCQEGTASYAAINDFVMLRKLFDHAYKTVE